MNFDGTIMVVEKANWGRNALVKLCRRSWRQKKKGLLPVFTHQWFTAARTCITARTLWWGLFGSYIITCYGFSERKKKEDREKCIFVFNVWNISAVEVTQDIAVTARVLQTLLYLSKYLLLILLAAPLFPQGVTTVDGSVCLNFFYTGYPSWCNLPISLRLGLAREVC